MFERRLLKIPKDGAVIQALFDEEIEIEISCMIAIECSCCDALWFVTP